MDQAQIGTIRREDDVVEAAIEAAGRIDHANQVLAAVKAARTSLSAWHFHPDGTLTVTLGAEEGRALFGGLA